MTVKSKSVSLVLGSGGARGLAHIGIIRWLEENGYQIRSIAGASMGALVGGIHAIGKLDEFEPWIRAVTRHQIVTLLDVSLVKGGLFKGDRVIESLKGLVGDAQIETLDVAYTAVATDLNQEKEVWINRGSLFDAIRASISLPLFFTPVNRRGALLIDGGVLNPVPIAPTFGDDTDLTIAVNLCGPPTEPSQRAEHHPEAAEGVAPFGNRIVAFINELGPLKKAADDNDIGLYDIANQSFDAMQGTIARQKLAAYPPDVTIEIARNLCGTLEFHRAGEMIEAGYQMAQQALAGQQASA